MKKTFYTSDRNIWRKWLLDNYKIEKEIYFVFPTVNSNEPSLSYNDAVEEALCFNWIDSTAGKLDELHGYRRFTPRKDYSYFSHPNIERLIYLDKQNKIIPEEKEKIIDVLNKEFIFSKDIIDELKKDEVVWANYNSFSLPYRRIRVAYIDAARKRKDEFKKRLNSFIDKTRKNQIIKGFGGIDKYYH